VGAVESKKWETHMMEMKVKLSQSDLETSQLLEAAEMLENESKSNGSEITNLRNMVKRLEVSRGPTQE